MVPVAGAALKARQGIGCTWRNQGRERQSSQRDCRHRPREMSDLRRLRVDLWDERFDPQVNFPDLQVNQPDLQVNQPDLQVNQPDLQVNQPDPQVN